MKYLVPLLSLFVAFQALSEPVTYEITGVNPFGDFKLEVHFDDADPSLQPISDNEYAIPNGVVTVMSNGNTSLFGNEHDLMVRAGEWPFAYTAVFSRDIGVFPERNNS